MSVSKPPPGHFTILYFASATSATKKAAEHLQAPLPLGKLCETLEQCYPGITANVLLSCALTLNYDYVDLTEDGAIEIKAGDEVAVIPPVSSG